jgi:hypothetical protein
MANNSPEVVAERRELVVRLFNEGCSRDEIAEQVGISVRRVYDHLTKAGCLADDYQPPPPQPLKLQPMRLVDVPLEERMAAAVELLPDLVDEEERAAVLAAVAAPSDATYWVPRLDAGTDNGRLGQVPASRRDAA